jgi:hypothetical protein
VFVALAIAAISASGRISQDQTATAYQALSELAGLSTALMAALHTGDGAVSTRLARWLDASTRRRIYAAVAGLLPLAAAVGLSEYGLENAQLLVAQLLGALAAALAAANTTVSE